MNKQKSSCCNASVKVAGDITKYYVCSKCNKSCDIRVIDKIDEKFDKEVLNNLWDQDNNGELFIRTDLIKQFYNKEISKLLKDIVGEEYKRYKKGDFLEHRDEFNYGHNKKRQEIIDKIKASSFKDLI